MEKDLEAKFQRNHFRRTFQRHFPSLIHNKSRNKPTMHIVIEMSAKLRRISVNKRRLYVGFIFQIADDYIVVPSFVKCQDLGHVSELSQIKKKSLPTMAKWTIKNLNAPRKSKPQYASHKKKWTKIAPLIGYCGKDLHARWTMDVKSSVMKKKVPGNLNCIVWSFLQWRRKPIAAIEVEAVSTKVINKNMQAKISRQPVEEYWITHIYVLSNII